MKPLAALLPLLALPATLLAQEAPPRLIFPVDCTLGETCFLQQFVDRDPGPGSRAFDCGPQSYDGHAGTDIRLADLADLAADVAVLAAADGVVQALRDGIADAGTAAAPPGQGCGNGVLLRHPGGWETQYCHLREGSIAVRPGEEVTAGAVLGRIGYSGNTEFPHLEFLLRHAGATVDPFDPGDASACATGTPPLWAAPIDNPGGGILDLGFAEAVPAYEAIQAGAAGTGAIATQAPGLVLWAYLHGGRAGDVVTLRIADGDGAAIHAQEVRLDRSQAQLFRAAGRSTPATGWPPGLYHGEVRLLRGSREIDRAETSVLVLP
jgi:hypothetical protein